MIFRFVGRTLRWRTKYTHVHVHDPPSCLPGSTYVDYSYRVHAGTTELNRQYGFYMITRFSGCIHLHVLPCILVFDPHESFSLILSGLVVQVQFCLVLPNCPSIPLHSSFSSAQYHSVHPIPCLSPCAPPQMQRSLINRRPLPIQPPLQAQLPSTNVLLPSGYWAKDLPCLGIVVQGLRVGVGVSMGNHLRGTVAAFVLGSGGCGLQRRSWCQTALV